MLKHYDREKLVWSCDLPSNEKLLLLVLNSFVDGNGECWPGQEMLSRMCSFSDRTVRNLCASLEKKGVIAREQRQDYELIWINISGITLFIGTWEKKPNQRGVFAQYKTFVLSRDEYACVYCGSEQNLSLDHVIPQSKGGSHEPENLVCCCKSCNSSKRDRTPEEWMEAKNGKP